MAEDSPASAGDDHEARVAFVEEHVQRALAPYRHAFAPGVLAELEEELRCFLLTHPVASRMLARIRPRSGAFTDDKPLVNTPQGGIPDVNADKAG